MSSPQQSAGLLQQIRDFSGVFWIANVMEMFERLAYYGLRTVLPVYMVLSVEAGGPQFDHIQKGSIYAWWALVQSGLPVFTGGYADRFGYKLTVGVAIAVKIAGYLVMGYALELALVLSGGTSAGVAGHWVTFLTFGAGALLLAAGTAIFKPGLQGIIGMQLKESNAAVGWSVFYQIVNVGGFLGPFLAGYMRLLAWKYVFISCAIIVALNYIFLFVFEEPPKEASVDDGNRGWLFDAGSVLWNSTIGICEPRLMSFLVVFSGFWAMFHQLFDLLPNYIDDWVDSRGVANAIAAPMFRLVGSELPAEWGGNVPQEYMININAGMCMTFAFLVGYLTGKMRSMTAMISGILIATLAIESLGWTTNGWGILLAIVAFSFGELMSSPTKMRYFSNLAPPGKKALYLGYINATGGIGWFLGSLIAGALYETSGDKVVLARKYLVEFSGQAPALVKNIPKDDVIPAMAAAIHGTPDSVRLLLLETYHPNEIWNTFALIGLISMVGLIIFDRITHYELSAEKWLLMALTGIVSTATYGWKSGLFFSVLILIYIGIEALSPQLLPQGGHEKS